MYRYSVQNGFGCDHHFVVTLKWGKGAGWEHPEHCTNRITSPGVKKYLDHLPFLVPRESPPQKETGEREVHYYNNSNNIKWRDVFQS